MRRKRREGLIQKTAHIIDQLGKMPAAKRTSLKGNVLVGRMGFLFAKTDALYGRIVSSMASDLGAARAQSLRTHAADSSRGAAMTKARTWSLVNKSIHRTRLIRAGFTPKGFLGKQRGGFAGKTPKSLGKKTR